MPWSSLGQNELQTGLSPGGKVSRAGDAANVILSAIGHNFRRILAWLKALWCLVLTSLFAPISDQQALRSAS